MTPINGSCGFDGFDGFDPGLKPMYLRLEYAGGDGASLDLDFVHPTTDASTAAPLPRRREDRA